MRRSYGGGAEELTLSAPLDGVSLSFSTVETPSGSWPDGGGGPFLVVMDRGLASEEKMLVEVRSGSGFTVLIGNRGADDTSGVSHSAGAKIEHCLGAIDLDEPNEHINSTALDQHTQYFNALRAHTASAALTKYIAAGSTPFDSWYAAGGPTAAAIDPAHVTNLSGDQIVAVPFVAEQNRVADRLGVRVEQAVAASNVRLGIYRSTSQTNMFPNDLVVDAGAVDSSTIGVKTLTINTPLSGGVLYWVVMLATEQSPNAKLLALTPGTEWRIIGAGGSLQAGFGQFLVANQAYGALPASFPGTIFRGEFPDDPDFKTPGLFLRFSS